MSIRICRSSSSSFSTEQAGYGCQDKESKEVKERVQEDMLNQIGERGQREENQVVTQTQWEKGKQETKGMAKDMARVKASSATAAKDMVTTSTTALRTQSGKEEIKDGTKECNKGIRQAETRSMAGKEEEKEKESSATCAKDMGTINTNARTKEKESRT